jgi:hypothetical protein
MSPSGTDGGFGFLAQPAANMSGQANTAATPQAMSDAQRSVSVSRCVGQRWPTPIRSRARASEEEKPEFRFGGRKDSRMAML